MKIVTIVIQFPDVASEAAFGRGLLRVGDTLLDGNVTSIYAGDVPADTRARTRRRYWAFFIGCVCVVAGSMSLGASVYASTLAVGGACAAGFWLYRDRCAY